MSQDWERTIAVIYQDVWIPEIRAYIPRALLSRLERDGLLIGWGVWFDSFDTLGRQYTFRRIVIFYGVSFWGLE